MVCSSLLVRGWCWVAGQKLPQLLLQVSTRLFVVEQIFFQLMNSAENQMDLNSVSVSQHPVLAVLVSFLQKPHHFLIFLLNRGATPTTTK